MSRGKKLDLFIGAEIEDSWAVVESPRKTQLQQDLEPAKHLLIFKKEKRKGKTVTLVGEFHMPKEQTNEVLADLKKKLGRGGSFKEGFMEFQGEIKEKVRELLVAKGFRFKQGH